MPRVDYPYANGRLKEINLSTIQNRVAWQAFLETLKKNLTTGLLATNGRKYRKALQICRFT